MLKLAKQTKELKSFQTRISGGVIYARTNAKPPPANAPVIVLIHGFVVSGAYMIPLASLLCARCRVCVPDLPGYGESYKPEHAPTVPEEAELLAEWLDVMGLDSVHLLANSYGCQIAAEFAARYPERVKKLILAGPTVDPKTNRLGLQAAKWTGNMAFEPPALSAVMMKDYALAGGRIIRETLHHSLNDRIEEKLPRIKAATLIVRGSKDLITSRRWGKEACELCRNGTLKIIPGYGHTLNFTAPLELARLVFSFLQLDPRLPDDRRGIGDTLGLQPNPAYPGRMLLAGSVGAATGLYLLRRAIIKAKRA